jgi:hypothetical protein
MNRLLVTSLLVLVTLAGKAQVPPLVYEQENTDAQYVWPNMPAVSELPVQRELPDALKGVNSFADWARRRSEIAAQIQHYGIGLKPTVGKEQVKARMDGDTLIVDVTVNGQTLTLRSEIRYPVLGQAPYALMIGTSGIRQEETMIPTKVGGRSA